MPIYNIYKKDSAGNIRYLEIEAIKDALIQRSGIIGTINPIEHKKLVKGKNIGKSNETTPEQQAIKQAEALVVDKLTKGYFNTKEEAEKEVVILPMLAKDYKKESHKINYKDIIHCQMFVQPKLDGMRCLAHIMSLKEVVLKSRDGKVINNMMHIEADLLKLAEASGLSTFPQIFDGELYIHGEDFQTNMEYIKKYRKGLSEKIQLNIYDMVNSQTFRYRKDTLSLLSGMSAGLKLNGLYWIRSHQINSELMLKQFHAAYLKTGFEGTMVRFGSSQYKPNGRSSGLLKYKDFLDLALPIMDIVPCKDRPEWGEPKFYWEGAKDDTLGAGMKYSHDDRIDFLLNKEKYIGKTAELRFFEYSNKGVPRFPVMVGIRLDK